MSRTNDVIVKEIRYMSVCGCEKRNVHELGREKGNASGPNVTALCSITKSLAIRSAAPAKKEYERVLQTAQLGYHAMTKAKLTPRFTTSSVIKSLRPSRIRLPTEGLTLA